MAEEIVIFFNHLRTEPPRRLASECAHASCSAPGVVPLLLYNPSSSLPPRHEARETDTESELSQQPS